MYVDAETIVTAGALVTAVSALTALMAKVVKWYQRQNRQDEDIERLARRHAEDMAATKAQLK